MFIKEAWFWRGFQSAIFYYISCAPCTKVLDQRKKKQKAARAKAERSARKAAQAQSEATADQAQYDHPLPSSTNPFWEEEMHLGPGPPQRRRNNHRQPNHGSEGQGRGSGRGSKEKTRKREMTQVNGLPPAAKSADDTTTTSNGKAVNGTNPPHNTIQDIPQIKTYDPPPADTDWNRQRYQREDEVLWGLEDEDNNDNDNQPNDKPGPAAVRTTPQLSRNSSSIRGHNNNNNGSRRSYHNYARNPAVNDLHPPVVSTAPNSRTETQWMLQPPPRAKIMEGKERENRSRSGTGSTHSSRASSKRGVGVGRQLSNHAFETMVTLSPGLFADGGKGGGESMSRSRGSSKNGVVSGQQRQDREREKAPSSSSSVGHPSPTSLQPSRSNSQRIKNAAAAAAVGSATPPPPPPLTLDNNNNNTTSNQTFLAPSPMLLPRRPGLQTIPSTSLVTSSHSPLENRTNRQSDDISTTTTTTTTPLHPPSKGPSSATLPPPSLSNTLNRSSSLTNTNTNTNLDTSHTHTDTLKENKKPGGVVGNPIPPTTTTPTSTTNNSNKHNNKTLSSPFPGAENGWGLLPANSSAGGSVRHDGDMEGDGDGDIKSGRGKDEGKENGQQVGNGWIGDAEEVGKERRRRHRWSMDF